MSTPENFSEALELVGEYLPRAGEEILDRTNIETDHGDDGSAFLVQHGNHQLQVVGLPTREFFEVRYQITVIEPLAQQAAIRDVIGGEPPEEDMEIDVEITDEHVQNATQRAVQILNSQDSEKKQKLRRKFVRMLSEPSEGVSYSLLTVGEIADTDVSGVVGFYSQTRIWPFEPSFSPSDVYRACQAAISTGLPVATLLQRQFGVEGALDEMFETAGVTTPDERETRGFM